MITENLVVCVVWAGGDLRRPYLLYSQLKNPVEILLMIRETVVSLVGLWFKHLSFNVINN